MLGPEEAAALGGRQRPPPEPNGGLEEALQVCLQMWSNSEERFDGEYFHLGRTVNSPAAITRPHPPIIIGASGDERRLQLVTAFRRRMHVLRWRNFIHDLDALHTHCDVKSGYDEIEKSVIYPFRPGSEGSGVGQIVDDLGRFSELGITVAIGTIDGVESITPIEIVGERVIPEVTSL